MRSGAKTQIVSFFEKVETVDPNYNTPIYAEEPFLENVFCKIIHRKGGEHVIDNQIVSRSYYRFEFDYLDVEDVNETMILIFDGIRFDIASIMRDYAGKDYIQIDAVETARGSERA